MCEMELLSLDAIRNYQHFFLNEMFSFVGGWGVNFYFVTKNVDMYCMNACARKHGWRYSVCSCGEVASLGCVKDRAGRWQGPPSVVPRCSPHFWVLGLSL